MDDAATVFGRLNRTLFDMARPSLIKAKLPTPFWAEAIRTGNKIRHRLPTKALQDNKSSFLPSSENRSTSPPNFHGKRHLCIRLPLHRRHDREQAKFSPIRRIYITNACLPRRQRNHPCINCRRRKRALVIQIRRK